MKRSIILFAAAMLVMVGWSQTMTINFKDGSVVNQNVSNISSFEITDDNQSDNGDNQGDDDTQGENQELSRQIVGTWKETKEDRRGLNSDITLGLSYIQFNSDGTWFSVKIYEEYNYKSISKGRWHVFGENLIVNTKEGKITFYPTKWTIKSIESNELTLTFDKATAYLTKVNDSEIERHLPSNFNRGFYCKGGYDCMEDKTLTIDGEQYYASRWSTVDESNYFDILYIQINPFEDITYYSPSTRTLELEVGGGRYVLNHHIGEVNLFDRATFASGYIDYSIVDGSVYILEITEYYLTIRLDNIKIRLGDKEHTYSGTVVLKNSRSAGTPLMPLPFDKPND